MSTTAVEAPIAVGSEGALKVAWIPLIADVLNPLPAELNAAGAIDLTLYIIGGGYAPSTSEETIEDTRLGSRQTFGLPGRLTETNEITYVYQPQHPEALDNRAYAEMKRLARGYLVTRWGKDFEPAFGIGDIVDIIPSICGEQRKQPPETNSQLKVTQTLSPTGVPRRDIVVG